MEIIFFVVDPFDIVIDYFRDKQITVYNYVINDLKDRFHNRNFVIISYNIEDLLLSGLNNSYDYYMELFTSPGFF